MFKTTSVLEKRLGIEVLISGGLGMGRAPKLFRSAPFAEFAVPKTPLLFKATARAPRPVTCWV